MIEADRVHSTPPLNTSVHNPTDGLSRRHMMAGLAALPAAVPAVAAAASAVGTDAELIALGKKLETLVDAYYVARQPWALALSERNSALEERFGAPADRGYRDPPEYEAAAKEIDARLGLDAAADQLHTVFEKIEPIALAIEALPCTSIEGLRAKALVAFWEVAPLCADDTEFHFEDAWPFRQLFSAVAEICGLNSKIASTGFDMPCSGGDDEEEA